MSEMHRDALWRGFPKTLSEFDERFCSEEACRDYLAECRWNGEPVCSRCGGVRGCTAAHISNAPIAGIRRA